MAEARREKPLLLIADDDPELMGILLKRLQQSDEYEFITASDGIKALEMIRTDRPDAVILDVMMPKKNGWEVLKEIRKSGASPAGIKDALRQLRQHAKAIKPAMQPKRGR